MENAYVLEDEILPDTYASMNEIMFENLFH